ncbi:uncharacterized protein LOC126743890 isoform X2 [Anthonomus grandis grandis]|uniref:uncharacterized protein LOC126743890 isoform X2 n=1 Tax=Anthonomus grandis grandis TaxID=2921223 RepID=UPI002166598B|nr:uncharacterized protein LOC126743890 isoform X2 [Anthonomus grandis grandis]
MKWLLNLTATICYLNLSAAEEVRLLDLEPNEAENIIEQQDQTLNYAPKIESNVPAVRLIGQVPHEVLEDIYLAKQYHGQDGLGGYLYGYQIPDISKNERKKASGDLKGSYNYINGAGQEIKVEYWDNGNGFHQSDNIPQILPQQIEESPEVKAAKDAFLKRWQEEAERNSHPIDPFNGKGQYVSGPLTIQEQQTTQLFGQQFQGAASAQQKIFAQPQQQNNEDNFKEDEGKYVPEESEESTGPPKGFFYKFDYPVGIITQDKGRALNVGKDGDLRNVYEQNKQRFERQLENGGGKSDSRYFIAKK